MKSSILLKSDVENVMRAFINQKAPGISEYRYLFDAYGSQTEFSAYLSLPVLLEGVRERKLYVEITIFTHCGHERQKDEIIVSFEPAGLFRSGKVVHEIPSGQTFEDALYSSWEIVFRYLLKHSR